MKKHLSVTFPQKKLLTMWQLIYYYKIYTFEKSHKNQIRSAAQQPI